jgi:putative glutamine amidotransferase
MKKYALLLIVSVLVATGISGQEAQVWKTVKNQEIKNLVLTHPTLYNLKAMKNLLDQKFLSLDGYRLIGAFHKHERYDYEQSRNYIDTASFSGVEVYLHEFTDTIYQEVIYRENPLSDDYRKILENSEGVVFFGGPDLPPKVYDEKTSLHTSIYDPYRHYFELSFLFHLLGGYQDGEFEPLLNEHPDYLIYGFCLGMQTMNVATGGTMIQDIPSEIYNLQYVEDVLKLDPARLHRNYHNRLSIEEDLLSGHFHRINLETPFFSGEPELKNVTPSVYSNHHQAVDDIGKGFQIAAASMDGKVVEALRHEKFSNVLGVQFHPEAVFLYDEEDNFQISPDDTSFMTGPEMLKKTNSLEFHRKFWKEFQQKLNIEKD